MFDEKHVDTVGSVRDLPSLIELEKAIADFEAYSDQLTPSVRDELESLRSQYEKIVGTVDRFYELLGPRNWVFTDDLAFPEAESISQFDDADQAEEKIVAYYKTPGRIEFSLKRLARLPAMRPRLDLLEKALHDYRHGRHYSTILVVISVMDGFVNDLNPAQRKGLHTRNFTEMSAWDSVINHHSGLAHAHKSFTKPFSTTQRDEVHDLYRHGIMHGNIVNFNNEIVSSKAWNRLFAVADWATARLKQSRELPAEPSLDEVMASIRRVRQNRALMDQWEKYDYEVSDAADEYSPVTEVCRSFLERWQKQQWKPLGEHFMINIGQPVSDSDIALSAKGLFKTLPLNSSRIVRVRHHAPALAFVDVELQVSESSYNTTLRWVHIDDDGKAVPEWEAGRWSLAPHGPTHFLKEKYLSYSNTQGDD